MNIEGRLSVTLEIGETGIVPTITSSRPTHASRLFAGKRPEQILEILPLLFNVCGKAQATAAVRAIESATGRTASDAIEQQRQTIVFAESLREHLWRILIDWRDFVGREIEQTALSKLTLSLTKLSKQLDPDSSLMSLEPCAREPDDILRQQWTEIRPLIETVVYGMPLETWLHLDNAHEFSLWAVTGNTIAALCINWIVDKGWQDLGRSNIEPLPQLDAAELRDILDSDAADEFIAAPGWHGRCYETGALSRQLGHPLVKELFQQHGNGLVTRLTARLTEIGELINALERYMTGNPDSLDIRSEDGLATVEAARGRLIHRATINGNRVENYRILAPTEWNFHPDGTATHSLAALPSSTPVEVLEQQARLIIQAIDPCVGFDLNITDAPDRDDTI